MAQVIMLREYGGPDQLEPMSVHVPAPGPGEIKIRQTAIGVNFHDIYVRSGSYRTLPLPGIPGIEGVGVVEQIGLDVEGIAIGDRVGYVSGSYGAYASERLFPASLAIKLPESLGDRLAATVLLKGLTAHMLVRQVHRIGPGMTVLVHAAAGGVGRLVCQWAAHLGATVIGTAGNPEKQLVARAAGCAHVIPYREVDFVSVVAELTEGKGVDVVYDSVGKDTFSGSLQSLAIFGHLVSFGQSSGPVEPVRLADLAGKSNTLTRPILFHWSKEGRRIREMAQEVFAAFDQNILSSDPGEAYALSGAQEAHRSLEAGTNKRPLILIPS